MADTVARKLFTTTVIGSFPKPVYLKIPSWFQNNGDGPNQNSYDIQQYTEWQNNVDQDQLNEKLARGYAEVVKQQIDLGIDVITDGELARENYIHFHCRQLTGFDFDNAEMVTYRNGATQAILPKVVGKVEAGEPFLVDTFKQVQAMSSVPIKCTVPGPMTIRDTSNNTFYENPEELCWDLAVAVNVEILRLVEAGCKFIQVDEPLFARQVSQAKQFGFRCLDRCLEGVPDDVYTAVHICCGYSDSVDQEDYQKAENHSYVQMVTELDACKFNAVSIEDAHTRIPDEFFTRSKRIDLIVGCVQVVRSGCLPVDQIVQRVQHIVGLGVDAKRILLAPDCGLAMLSIELVTEKLNNMKSAREQLQALYQN